MFLLYNIHSGFGDAILYLFFAIKVSEFFNINLLINDKYDKQYPYFFNQKLLTFFDLNFNYTHIDEISNIVTCVCDYSEYNNMNLKYKNIEMFNPTIVKYIKNDPNLYGFNKNLYSIDLLKYLQYYSDEENIQNELPKYFKLKKKYRVKFEEKQKIFFPNINDKYGVHIRFKRKNRLTSDLINYFYKLKNYLRKQNKELFIAYDNEYYFKLFGFDCLSFSSIKIERSTKDNQDIEFLKKNEHEYVQSIEDSLFDCFLLTKCGQTILTPGSNFSQILYPCIKGNMNNVSRQQF